jgi:hypothetical protein
MARRTLNRMELRAAAEAAEAMGIKDESPSRSTSGARKEPERRPKPSPSVRMRVVWAVCDSGGRTVATFEYAQKADAETHMVTLKAQGKGTHFLRSVKEPMSG